MSKIIYCGECEKFLYEDTDGFGRCGKTKEVCYCGECEHFDPDYDPYGLFDGYCDLYERGRNKNSECYAK